MDKYIFDESNGLWYERQGDYYIPCLTLPAEEEQSIGLWGQRHLRYIREYRKALYASLVLEILLDASALAYIFLKALNSQKRTAGNQMTLSGFSCQKQPVHRRSK